MSIESSSLKFSGHQTFPLRYGWIYKIIKEIREGRSISSQETVESQMSSMGMGKNMVLSVRYWVRTIGLVTCTDHKEQTFELTNLAKKLFTECGDGTPFDEYIDKIGTIWLLHWLAQSIRSSDFDLNTPRWFFNFFNGIRCDKLQLTRDINLSLAHHDKDVTEATLQKDIDCFFQSYVKKNSVNKKQIEDSFTSPFSELGLLVQIDSKHYLAELSDRKTLPIEVFFFAVIDFVQKRQKNALNKIISNEKTVSFNSLLRDIGSPGRIFRLTEKGLSDKLDELEKLTSGKFAWTDSQGLRQLRYSYTDIHSVAPEKYLKEYYKR